MIGNIFNILMSKQAVKRTLQRLKVIIGEYYIRPWLQELAAKGKGPASRLCSAASIAPSATFDGIRTLHDPVPIPIVEPLFYQPGKIENNYVRRLKQSSTETTTPLGVISASRVLVSFPTTMHRWEGKIFQEALLNTSVLTNPKYFLQSELISFKRKRLMSEAVLLSMPWHHNFYHWLIEILPRLQIVDANEDLLRLLLVVSKSSPSFVKNTLAILGYQDRTLFLDNGVVEFEKLHLPTRMSTGMNVSPLAVDWLRKKFLKPTSASAKRRIYVSRRDARIRYITNESEVEQLLSDFGFEIVCMSDYSFEEQVEIFQHAQMIVGSHGAAFSHLAFAPSGATFIEFFEQGHMAQCFYRLANIRKLRYGFLVGKPEGLGFSVNVNQLRELLTKATAL